MPKTKLWLVRLLVVVGLVFLVRSIMEFSEPNYWRPQNPFDYVAVYLTTIVDIGYSAIFVLMLKLADFPTNNWKKLWQVSMLVAIVGFALSGIGNLLEDAFNIRDVGEFLFTLGIYGMLGLMVGFILLLFLPEIRKRWGWFFALFIAATIISYDNSGLIIGPGMLVLAWQENNRD